MMSRELRLRRDLPQRFRCGIEGLAVERFEICPWRQILDKITAHSPTPFLPPMANESPALIDRSIAQLESLAAFLADEVQRPRTTAVLPPSDRRLCKEALLTISVLLPKLHAVRRVHAPPPDPQAPRCPSCDD